ncbi:MAG: hypothetical protein FJX65_14110 [Alphaproteobacteria bacterium]|nr:hypothetical protein [Alphaproteobacteria bacterium]
MSDYTKPKNQIVLPQGDVKTQATQAVDVIAKGGVAIIPLDVAYGIVSNAREGIARIFSAKQRSYAKPSGMFSNYDLLKEIQIIEPEKHAIIKAVIHDHNLPFSTVAPFRADHPIFKNLDPWVLQTSSKVGTLDMLLNAGAFHNAMTKLGMARGLPIFGSSANTSLSGSKYTLDSIEKPVRDAADILVDGGLCKYHNPEGRSSTIIDFRTFKTVRVGVVYDKLCEIFLKFKIDLKAIGMAA